MGISLAEFCATSVLEYSALEASNETNRSEWLEEMSISETITHTLTVSSLVFIPKYPKPANRIGWDLYHTAQDWSSERGSSCFQTQAA